MEVPRLGVESEVELLVKTKAIAMRGLTTSATYTTVHSNTQSLTHWARPGIEPATSWFLVGFISAVPWWELLLLLFLTFVTSIAVWKGLQFHFFSYISSQFCFIFWLAFCFPFIGHIEVDVALATFLLFKVLCKKRHEEIVHLWQPYSLCTILFHISLPWAISELQK